MPRPIITFTSDFGLEDWFVGVVHGVLHGICPDCRVVDLTHQVHAGHIARAAFVLGAAAPEFPPDTVHLAVVDPGVGTKRRAIAVRARGQYFVGPDNGLLEWGLADSSAVIHELTETGFFRSPVSRTFHGRDVFGPVAAHLALGVPIERLGPRADRPVRLERPVVRRGDGALAGCVMFVDRFGNALTNVSDQELAEAFPNASGIEVVVANRVVRGLARSYGDAPVGALLALVGSSGYLEIAQVGGDASERLGLGEGDPVIVRPRP